MVRGYHEGAHPRYIFGYLLAYLGSFRKKVAYPRWSVAQTFDAERDIVLNKLRAGQPFVSEIA